MSTRPKPVTQEKPRRANKRSGVKVKGPAFESTIDVEESEDPFAEFHDGWEPVRKRRSAPPNE